MAYDGDGDRVMMVDHKGRVFDGDDIVYIIAKRAFDNNELNGGVVGTVMSNMGLENALTARGIPFERSKVGDRYVLELMKQKGWKIWTIRRHDPARVCQAHEKLIMRCSHY